jgi:hypothetical protein
MQMATSNTFKILGVIILSGAIFAAGYFWGQSKVHQQMVSGQQSGGEMAGMKGMSDMPGMAGMNMAPGTAMVSAQMQQLMGVRTAIVEPKTLSKTIRAVGTVAYDESRVKHVHSKVDGWSTSFTSIPLAPSSPKDSPCFPFTARISWLRRASI